MILYFVFQGVYSYREYSFDNGGTWSVYMSGGGGLVALIGLCANYNNETLILLYRTYYCWGLELTGDCRIFAPRSKIQKVQSVPYLAYQVAYNNIVASNTLVSQFELFALHGAKILQSPVLCTRKAKSKKCKVFLIWHIKWLIIIL